MKRHSIPITIALLIIFGGLLFVSQRAATTPQELRNKAAVQGGVASVMLTPSSRSFLKGTPATITLSANIPSGRKIDGFQVILDITGINTTVSFQQSPIAGIKAVRSDIVTRPYLGKRLTLVYISNDPLTPYQGTGLVTLGKLNILSTITGSISLSFNSTLTKIAENTTTQDIVNIPKNAIYTFTYGPTPTPIRYYPTPTKRPYYPTPTPVRYYPTPTRYIYPSPTRYYPKPTPIRYYPTPPIRWLN